MIAGMIENVQGYLSEVGDALDNLYTTPSVSNVTAFQLLAEHWSHNLYDTSLKFDIELIDKQILIGVSLHNEYNL